MTSTLYIRVVFRGKEYQVVVDPSSTTLGQVVAVLANDIPDLAPYTLKLLISKPKPMNLQMAMQANTLLSEAGVVSGTRATLLGSFTHELQGLAANAAAEANMRLPGFEYEAKRTAQRSRGAVGAASLAAAAAAAGRFGSFTELPLLANAPPASPPPAAALSLLHRLAADPAITAVMMSHGWTVGLLSEMPPEGKVGISSVCILGYNVNKGQEISLRLRTDDYRGFRKYLRIRETLVHELAHMVHSEHDNDFKALNSQLLKEVAQHEAAAGRTLAGSRVFEDSWLGGEDEPTTTAAAVEQKGRVLAVGEPHSSSLQGWLGARESAAAAALARWQINQQQQQQQHPQDEGQQQQQQQQQPQQQCGAARVEQPASSSATEVLAVSSAAPAAASSGIPSAAQQTTNTPRAAVLSSAAAAAAAGSNGDVFGLPAWYDSSMEGDGMTDDPATAAAEEQMTRLGSFQPGGDDDWTVQQQQHMNAEQQWQQQHMHAEQQQLEQLSCTQTESAHKHQQQLMHTHEATYCTPDTNTLPRTACQQPVHSSAAVTGVAGTQLTGLSVAAAAEPAGTTDDVVSELAAGDDVVMRKLGEAQSLLLQLQHQAGGNFVTAVQALAGVLGSIAEHPNDPKYRRLRCSNAVFQRKMGQYPAAMKLLLLSGFFERQMIWQPQVDAWQPGSSQPELVLVYSRDDPGLLWLVISVVKGAQADA